MRELGRVTIVIPCFNADIRLIRAYESAKTQINVEVQVLIIDDGSTDPRTKELLGSLPTEVVVVKKQNQGLPAARNLGFSLAKTDYVLFLDADDWLESNYLDEIMKRLPTNIELFFAYSDIQFEEDRIGVKRAIYLPFSQRFLNQLPYCILLNKKSFPLSYVYDESMTQGLEDWDLNIRLLANNFMPIHIPSPLFHYSVSSMGMLQRVTLRNFHEVMNMIVSKNRPYYSVLSVLHAFRQQRKQFGAKSCTKGFLMWFFFFLFPGWMFNRIIRWVALS